MPTPDQAARNRRIRQAALLAAAAYIASRIWALEDRTANQIHAETFATFEALQRELLTVFMAHGADNWNATDPLFRQRTDAFLAKAEAAIKELTNTITGQALDGAIASYQSGYYGAAWTLANARPAASVVPATAIAPAYVTPALVPPPSALPIEAIRAAILHPYQGNTFLDRFAQARDEFVMRIRRSIVESQIKGESIGQATRRLKDALGLTATEGGYAGRVETIARTEILRSSNAASTEYYKKHGNVLSGWEWKATNDERTCPICGALDGNVYALDSAKTPPPEHPRCRCAAIPALDDKAIEQAIVGPRISYMDWSSRNGISPLADGGVLSAQRGKPAPKSSSPAAQQAARA